MRIPRDVSGTDLVKALRRKGYAVTRQSGSHIRITTQENSEHHVTIPAHDPLRVGTFANILDSVAEHFGIDRDSLLQDLDL